MIRSLLTSLAFLFCSGLTGQISIKASLDTTAMLIGSQQDIHIDIQAPSNAEIREILLEKADTSGRIEILSEPRDTLADGWIRKSYRFTVFDSGYYHILPVPVVIGSEAAQDTFYSNDLTLAVNNPPIDTSGLADIKPLMEEPLRLEDFLPWVYILGAIIVVIAIIIWLRRRKKKGGVPPPPPVVRPPHEVALEKLEKLRRQKLWQQGDVKGYYSELTFIIREYLENRYKFPALESTTGEIIDNLKVIETISPELKDQLPEFLRTSDLVKFAKALPALESHEKYFKFAESFIYNTRPQIMREKEEEG